MKCVGDHATEWWSNRREHRTGCRVARCGWSMIMWLFAFSCITETVSVYKTVDQENLTGRAEDTYLSDVESSSSNT